MYEAVLTVDGVSTHVGTYPSTVEAFVAINRALTAWIDRNVHPEDVGVYNKMGVALDFVSYSIEEKT